ncbi:MAG: alpha/beta fold hydrolase [Marmoricola sp.]
MKLERGTAAGLPWAATGTGRPVVVLSGVSPQTGVDSSAFVRTVLAPVRGMADRRRLYAFNRRRGLPHGLTMSRLAAEHAEAVRELFDEPVDVVGASTGGSIAQQLAAEHPDVVRRLVLISTGCRLGERARSEQAEMAQLLRADDVRGAGGLLATDVVPTWAAPVGRGLGRLVAPWILGGRKARADLATTLEAEDEFDLATCSGSVQAPTLIVGGARDRFYGADLLAETAALIEGSTLVVIPRRGHLTVMSDRRARARVAAFLDAGA